MIKMFVLFKLAQSMCLYVKLELNVLQDLWCKSALLDRSKIRLNRSKVMQFFFFFCRISNSTQACLTCRLLCFVLSIKWKTLATFLGSSLCCVCESSVRSRGVFLHIHSRFPISRLMSIAW